MAHRALSLIYGPVSPAAAGPLYEQVIANIKREVDAERLKPGHPLPSVRVLAADLSVSVITVVRAYEELERDGIILSRQGSGTFVADTAPDYSRRLSLQAVNAALDTAIQTARTAKLTDENLLNLLKSKLSQGSAT